MSQFPKTPARPSQADALVNARLERVQSKLSYAAELIADKMVETYSRIEEPDAPLEVRRRAMANALQIWRKCPRPACGRARACRGEPAHCLDACMPALPRGAGAAYVAASRRRKKRLSGI